MIPPPNESLHQPAKGVTANRPKLRQREVRNRQSVPVGLRYAGGTVGVPPPLQTREGMVMVVFL